FLRRTIFHFIEFPDRALMTRIVAVHFPNLAEELLKVALDSFYKVRAIEGVRKRPSTSELIDWIGAILVHGMDPETLSKELPFLGVLLKREQDFAQAMRAMASRSSSPRSSGQGR